MKIDEDIIRKIMHEIDDEATEDPEFIQTIEVMIGIMKQRQSDANKKRNNKTVLHGRE